MMIINITLNQSANEILSTSYLQNVKKGDKVMLYKMYGHLVTSFCHGRLSQELLVTE